MDNVLVRVTRKRRTEEDEQRSGQSDDEEEDHDREGENRECVGHAPLPLEVYDNTDPPVGVRTKGKKNVRYLSLSFLVHWTTLN
jgi:hypothetical protein